jgi:DNA-binding PadR family transcriptional regulator
VTGKALTEAQLRALREMKNAAFQELSAAKGSQVATLRALVTRGLITPSGVSQGREWFKLTDAGREALAAAEGDKANA